jgi:hypothetical protein
MVEAVQKSLIIVWANKIIYDLVRLFIFNSKEIVGMKHVLGVLLVFIGLSFTSSGKLFAHVETTYYLKGMVGARMLAVRMLCYDEMPTSYINYFFGDDKKDRLLVGNQQDQFWNFIPEETAAKGNIKTELSFSIAPAKEGVWKGSWTDSTGKISDLVLTPIDADSISSPYNTFTFVKELEPYERYRLINIQFSKTRVEKRSADL